MCWDWYRVTVALNLDEQSRIGGGDVDPFDHLGFLDQTLELGDREAIELALLALRQLGGFLVVLRRHLVVRIDDLTLAIDDSTVVLHLVMLTVSLDACIPS